MHSQEELSNLVGQRTWDKELLLWFGPEAKLRPFFANIHIDELDLLDLFDPAAMPIDDEEIRQHISESLRQRLKSIPRVSAQRTALIVRSAGLLARYRVGVQVFYDWFCDDFAMAILLIEGRCIDGEWPEEIECASDRLIDYFNNSGMVKRLIEA